jgi:hypothetical protein
LAGTYHYCDGVTWCVDSIRARVSGSTVYLYPVLIKNKTAPPWHFVPLNLFIGEWRGGHHIYFKNTQKREKMNTLIKSLFVIILFAAASGCSINHPVANDYPQYLSKNGNTSDLPKTNIKAEYLIENSTQNHRYEFRAATVGYAHLWIVEFGKILDQTLNAPYVQTSFGKLNKSIPGTENSSNFVEFTLEKYEFKNYRAYLTMKIVLSSSGKEILNKTYSSEGDAKGGQMWGAGPFGMKNATLDSTKSAIDKVLSEFITDVPKT